MKRLIVGVLAALAISLAGAPVANAEGDSTFHPLLAKDFYANPRPAGGHAFDPKRKDWTAKTETEIVAILEKIR